MVGSPQFTHILSLASILMAKYGTSSSGRGIVLWDATDAARFWLVRSRGLAEFRHFDEPWHRVSTHNYQQLTENRLWTN